MTQTLDPFGDSQAANSGGVATSEKLASVSVLIEEWDKNTRELARFEDWAKKVKERQRELEETAVPMAMADAGVQSFVATNGRVVKIEVVCRGNIPAPSTIEKAKGAEGVALANRRRAAVAYVAEHWPGLIKTELSVSLGKGETEMASRIAELIRKQFSLTPSIDETINHATLNSHFKELRDQGKLDTIPVETFALYVGPIAKIK